MTVKDFGYAPVVDSEANHGQRGDVVGVSVGETPAKTKPAATTPQNKKAQVVFSTPAVYDTIIWVLVAFGPAVVIMALIATWRDANSSDEDKRRALMSLFLTLLSILIVFVLVFPKGYEVRSDATLGIQTYFLTWPFSSVVEASENPTFMESLRRPRFKFATSMSGRVVVRRKSGWDVLVTPKDPQGFIRAIFEVAQASE